MPFARSLMDIKNNKDPKIEPCATPENTGVHAESWLFNTTPWSLLFGKL